MAKISTVAQHEQYPYGPYTVPYGPYELFLETRIKKTKNDLIDSLSILFTLHYKKTSPAAFRGVLGCSKP
jgi:hypothetical protein